MATVLQRSTNLNFPRKAKFNTSVHENEKTRSSTVVVTHHSATPNILRKKSKLAVVFDDLTRDVRRYPQLRPGVCTIIVGLVLLLTAILMFAVAAFEKHTALWFRILLIVGAATVLLGGTAALLRNYCLLKTQLQIQREQSLKMTPLHRGAAAGPGLNPASNPTLGTVIEVTSADFVAERLDGNASEAHRRKTPDGRTVDKLQKIVQDSNRRRLPGSPVAKSFGLDQHLDGNANSGGRYLQIDKANSDRLAYFSSEPDLVACGKSAEGVKLLKTTCLKPSAQAVKAHQGAACLNLEPSPNSSVADEIFDVFHDPLLYSAITRLKFKCDYEFLSTT